MRLYHEPDFLLMEDLGRVTRNIEDVEYITIESKALTVNMKKTKVMFHIHIARERGNFI